MKNSYTSPKAFAYGDFDDVVQWRIFYYDRWDFLTHGRKWLPW